jgi:hypothetical protein
MAQPRKFPQFPLSSPLTGNELVLLWQGLGNRRITLNTLSNFLGGGGAVGSSIYVDVRSFGTVGDGVVDDTDALQTAIDTANGRWIYFHRGDIYKITGTLNLPVGTKIFAYGAKVLSESHIYMLECQGDNIIEGLEIEGAGSTPFDDDGRAINFVGTVGSYKSGLKIEDCYIHDIGFYGVYHQFVNGLNVTKTKIHNVGYAGIMGLSVSDSYVGETHIKGIDFLEGGYGISFTRDTIVDTLEANPRSKNCTVENCLVEDNIQWKAYDTHGGDNIRFTNNTALNCRQGIGIVSAENFAPKNCSAVNNTIITTRGSDEGISWSAYGIVVAGSAGEGLSESLDSAMNNSVIGNVLIGCGQENNANEGAIRFRDSTNTRVIGNSIYQPLVNGIVITNTNFNFTVSGNTIIDPNSSNSEFFTTGIRLVSQYNMRTINGNPMYLEDPSLNTKVGDRGINVATASNNKLWVVNNPNNFVLSANIPTSVDIVVDNYHNNTLRINRASSSSNQQILFNEGFSIYTDDTGGQNVSDPVAFWLTGRSGTTAYISPRSGGPFKWVGINAETTDITSGRLRIAGSTATLENTGVRQNIDGTANSGNVFKLGSHITTISDGLANNYPDNTGLSMVFKTENSRILEYFANTTGTLWYRSLTTGSNNIWKKVITDFDVQGWYSQTSDPEVLGAIWNNGGVLTFSDGPIV